MKTRQNRILVSAVAALLMAGVLAVTPPALAAQDPVLLGTTSHFAVLAGSTITNTGPTTISGDAGADIGLYPGTSITGTGEITLINGVLHLADAVAQVAKTDLVTAYNDAAGRLPVQTIATELGGQTLSPGVYNSASGTFGITGTLTLDAGGDPNGVFIFLTESTLITASNSVVSLIGNARFCRVFWQVGSSATLGTNSIFIGHIMAMASITATTGATIQGQLMARTGAVTLDTNTIINGFCGLSPSPTPGGSVTQVPVITRFTPPVRATATLVPSATTLPPTGDTSTDWSTLAMLATGAGLVLVLAGISLYLSKRKKAKS